MLDRLLGFKIHDYLQVLGILILAFGLPMNKVLMSIGTIWLASNLLLKADLKSYWNRWKPSVVFWFILAVLAFHILGLSYTQDFGYAFKDLNTKLPLFVIPIAIIGYPIEKRYFNLILIVFLSSLLITSGINFYYMIFHPWEDYRTFSLFGSHIRYALLIVTGVLVALYLFLQKKKFSIIFLLCLIWFIIYTVLSQVLSGYIALSFLSLGIFIYFIRQISSRFKKTIGISLFLITIICGVWFLYAYLSPDNRELTFGELPKKTEYGNIYYHDTTVLWYENGHHVQSFIAGDELTEEWSKRSKTSLKDTTSDGYLLRDILIRYMTSKGLTKDKNGMQSMEAKDIQNVENGIASIAHTYDGIHRQMHQLKNEVFHYSVNGDPDGNSLLQRIEHWRAAIHIIENNWLFGVGTGDLQNAFDWSYENIDTRLDKENWNRAHNQFLTFWVAFGVFGFIIFCVFWLGLFVFGLRNNKLLIIGFSLIAISSFLSEDTLETQQGVTFIALFLGLFSLYQNFFFQKDKDSKKL
ncbi:hypothetical protein CW751_13505 [Brumimicrobium salinarum]|uniref:O-antigen ligase-related domain-containing protein n=1 Tax=Brumimicrobium salinarum TaxID=2058658 RepID=A0A2I0QZI3_9FLAO|nr:O-antigen ligase family protein [Brumimicrobium salinarum]PKR79736.1 hypothetical protein CW751_13505 [Brumimicrobium salinarum]